MAKRPLNISEMLDRIRAAVAPFRPAAMFELAEQGTSKIASYGPQTPPATDGARLTMMESRAQAAYVLARVARLPDDQRELVLALGTVPELKTALQRGAVIRIEGVISARASRAARPRCVSREQMQ